MNTAKASSIVTFRLTLTSLIILLLTVTGCVSTNEKTASTDNSCLNNPKSILISTTKHKLYLCKNNETIAEYRVSIGKGGYGKRKAEDNKTPIGTYPLGEPAPSNSGFHTFIPVIYPTPEQKANGYTGSEIGIHGPDQKWRYLGPLTLLKDWTRGCIAVSSNSEITEISNWVKKEDVTTVIIKI